MGTKTKTLRSLSLALLLLILVSTVSVTSALRNLSRAAENKGVWCVANNKATDQQLQDTIDWCCSDAGGFRDCRPINPGGVCYEPNTLRDHASYVMNSYYQELGSTKKQCTFSGTGTEVRTDPSHGACVYVSY
ncbi:PREDICTED: major pollen allergen Ole e 10-like [Camelina sativa]|uniref:Major pollen allergen Ole e 10-like n=1 Tax=Camelina sativa TaxID=90675 RepID=A0ABM0XCW2_CAMSA|nr:PREDICTED: major pollen allergen Ole e 10-like [Camelina sativa]